jgi:hypothetical protein
MAHFARLGTATRNGCCVVVQITNFDEVSYLPRIYHGHFGNITGPQSNLQVDLRDYAQRSREFVLMSLLLGAARDLQ